MATTAPAQKTVNPFMLFSQENREKVKADNPGIKVTEVGSKLGELWKALSDTEQQAYKDRAKTTFQAPKAPKEPKSSQPGVIGKPAKRVKKEKDPNAPKRSPNAFMTYSMQNRNKVVSENPGLPTKEISKLLGELWNALSLEEKAKYKKNESVVTD